MIDKSGSIPGLFKAIPFWKAKPHIAIAKIAKPSLPHSVPPRRPPSPTETIITKDCLDARQCRIWLNEAQREIDRLRRSIATPPMPLVPLQKENDEPPDPLASPPTARRLYAVDPIGKPPPPRDPLPATGPGAKVVTRLHVTNVGSVLDVLV